MKTTNGGQSWQVLQNHTIDYDLFDVNFINEDEGWAVGEFGLILHTINGGEIWHEQISDTIVRLK